jgi:chemotaxis protein MotB
MGRRKVVFEDPPRNATMLLYCSLFLIMLTFFVVLASLSVQDSRRQRLAIGSILGSFGVMPGGKSPFFSRGFGNVQPLSPPMVEAPIGLKGVETAMREAGGFPDISVSKGGLGVTVTVSSPILFEGDTDRIAGPGSRVLDAVAKVLTRIDNQVLVVGHTDSIPVERPPYESNWGLSASRALAVLTYLEGKGVRPERLTAYGMGSTRPVSDNATEEGRRLNNRVEIVIVGGLPGDLLVEEGPAGARAHRPKSIFYRGFRMDLEEK